jgi:hypothetical protein
LSINIGSEYCLTYQPGYATTRETWCPLTENNWISTPSNALKLSPSDSSLPLHIQMERVLLDEKPFSLVLNPNWFIDYAGVLTLSIPEATYSSYSSSVWKIVLPSTGRRPSNQRILLLYNCTDVRIRYNIADHDHYQTTILFVDMKTNSTFTIEDNLGETKRLCNPEILVPINDTTSTTSSPQTTMTSHGNITTSTTKQSQIQTTSSSSRNAETITATQPQTSTSTSNGENIDSSSWGEPSGFEQLIQSSFVNMICFLTLLFSVRL